MKQRSMIIISMFLSLMLALSGAGLLDLEAKTMQWGDFFTVFLSFGLYIELTLLLIVNIVVEKPSKPKKFLVFLVFVASLANLADHELNLLLTNIEDKKLEELRSDNSNKQFDDRLNGVNESLKKQYDLLNIYMSKNMLTKSTPIQKRISELEAERQALQITSSEEKKSDAESIAWKQFIRMMLFYFIFQIVNILNFHTFLSSDKDDDNDDSDTKTNTVSDTVDTNETRNNTRGVEIVFDGVEVLRALKDSGMSYSEIGKLFGVSKDTVSGSMKRESVKNPDLINGLKEYFDNN